MEMATRTRTNTRPTINSSASLAEGRNLEAEPIILPLDNRYTAGRYPMDRPRDGRLSTLLISSGRNMGFASCCQKLLRIGCSKKKVLFPFPYVEHVVLWEAANKTSPDIRRQPQIFTHPAASRRISGCQPIGLCALIIYCVIQCFAREKKQNNIFFRTFCQLHRFPKSLPG